MGPAAYAEPVPSPGKKAKPLFDERSLNGWEGLKDFWRVEEGALTGGSLTEQVKRNEFLANTRDFTNFIVRLKIKLTGNEGFINSGFQIRSQRVPNDSEMAGYQCDFGDPNWWGAIYDESRRNKVLSPSDMAAIEPKLKRNDWNDYVIRADGPRITTWLNGAQGTDYTENDASIPDWGKFGIQVHGGGKALVQVKDITVEELPPTTASKKFFGAPEPKKSENTLPRSPDDERTAFTLPPGFEIELVASESEGIGKFITVDWDTQGRMWSMTALEYPVDGNENPAAAKELYASRAKDKVLIFDRDAKSPTGYSPTPHVFAEGLAIPLGILPYKNGVYVQHGSDIAFLSDTDGDGKADKREVILSGFGVQDSHLFPHQFTRGPGNWIWMAQGAFNYGKVKTTRGVEKQFDQTRMARFRYDGSDFDITSQGPCNIWGLVLTAEGECFIQEANDFGYPVMPFHEYANYPGCSGGQWKSYAPEFPGTAPDFQMGGTGLSGLALSDKSVWPEAYADVMYVANPITRKIQAIKITRDGPRFRYQKLPDFIQSSDEMFRPVSIHFGPDGCLYIVDWYNKIISHNEVPRNHPDRDKKRGRIWRVKRSEQKPFNTPDFTKLPGNELIKKLGDASVVQHHLAWQAITDRHLTNLAPKLKSIVTDKSQAAAKRIGALWALEGLDEKERFNKGATYFEIAKTMLQDTDRNVRREAIRALGVRPLSVAGASRRWSELFDALEKATADSDPEVRSEVIKTTAQLLPTLVLSSDSATAILLQKRALPLLLSMARAPLEEPMSKSTQTGKPIKVREAYEREFERYLVRLLLEQNPTVLLPWLDSETAKSLPIENRLLATLALEPQQSATRLAKLVPSLRRPLGQEETLRLAQFLDEPGVSDALKTGLNNPASREATIETLLNIRSRVDATKLKPMLRAATVDLWAGDASARKLSLRLASSFQLTEMESAISEALVSGDPKLADDEIILALRTIRELGANQLEGILLNIRSPRTDVADEAVAALASSKNATAPQFLFNKFWQNLSAAQRRSAFNLLSGTKHGAAGIVQAVKTGAISKNELDGARLEKLHAVLGDDAELAALISEMELLFRPVLRLDGKDNAWVDSDITLDGPFTVETWVKLNAGIDNNDGILGAPGVLDMNFFGEQFRVWIDGGIGDAIVAKKKITADVWTHIAVTREGNGAFRIFQNGELDSDQGKPAPQKFEHCRIAWTTPAQGTAGWLNEFRVWDRARSADEIRADFDRSFQGDAKPGGLVHYFSATNWNKLQPGAKVLQTLDFPTLLNAAEAKVLAEKFSYFRTLAKNNGDAIRGKTLFTSVCMSCHSVAGQGGQVGPVLSGAGASGVEALLRNVLTPSAAMEAGYRIFRVEMMNGDVLDGILVLQDKDVIILRRPNTEDTRIASKDVRRAEFTKRSMMPEGLLEGIKPEEVSDLFAYLQTLK